MTLATDSTTAMLTELAQGKLAPAARRELAQRALRDPQLAAEMKLAMRLGDGSAELARDWVAIAARPVASHGQWWRPLAGAAASLAVVAAVLFMPRTTPVDHAAPVTVTQVSQQLPDQIGSGSFESPELFGGSFEAN